jgi:hypothetical protein
MATADSGGMLREFLAFALQQNFSRVMSNHQSEFVYEAWNVPNGRLLICTVREVGNDGVYRILQFDWFPA